MFTNTFFTDWTLYNIAQSVLKSNVLKDFSRKNNDSSGANLRTVSYVNLWRFTKAKEKFVENIRRKPNTTYKNMYRTCRLIVANVSHCIYKTFERYNKLHTWV